MGEDMSISEVQKLQYELSANGAGQANTGQDTSGAFGDLLKAKAAESQGLNFSKHAAKRIGERGISMDTKLLDNLEQAVEGARQKGAKNMAVIGGQGVFIVNVPNKIVITAMSAEDMKNRIFTNIDSAVMM